MTDHMHHAGVSHDSVDFESIGEVVPVVPKEAPQGLSMTSVNAPMGSVLGFLPRGAAAQPIRLYHAPKGTYPSPLRQVQSLSKQSTTLGGS